MKKYLAFTKLFTKNVLLLGSVFFLAIAIFYFQSNVFHRGASFAKADDGEFGAPSDQQAYDQGGLEDPSDQYPVDDPIESSSSQGGLGTPSDQYPSSGGLGYPTSQYPVESQPYVRYELRECDGNEVVVDRYWSDGRKEEVRRVGRSEGECGVPFPSGISQSNPVPSTQGGGGGGYASQPYVRYELRECDGNEVVVNRYWSDGNKEEIRRVGRSEGECGVPFPSGFSQTSYVPSTPVSGGEGNASRPYVRQEIRECDGNNVVINRYWSDGRKETVSQIGRSEGECGVPFPSATNSLSYVPATPVSGGNGNVSRPYVRQEIRECDGNNVVIDRYWSDGRKEVVSWIGRSEGECGVPFQTGSSALNPVPSTPVTGGQGNVSQPYVVKELRECQGNTVVLNRYWSDGRREVVANYGISTGECGVPFQRVVAASNPVPVTPASITSGTSSQPYLIKELRECSGSEVVVNQYWSDGRREEIRRIGRSEGECGVPFPSAIQAVVAGASTTNQTVAPTVQTTSGTTANTSINCPAGYTYQSINGTAFCMQNTVSGGATTGSTATSGTGSSNSNQPQVIYKTTENTVSELPKTGLPLAAWGVTGLLPFGMKLRKKNQKDDENLTGLCTSGNSLWVQRELNKSV